MKKTITMLTVLAIMILPITTTLAATTNIITNNVEETETQNENTIENVDEENENNSLEEDLKENTSSGSLENEQQSLQSSVQTFSVQETEEEEQVIENGVYKISTALSKYKMLDVSDGSKKNRTIVKLWSTENVENQKFEITYIGDGYYTIKAVHSGKVLDVADGSKANKTQVQQYESNGTDAQKWKIVDAGNGYYNLISKCNGLYLDVANAETSNGTKIQVYKGNGTKAQKFAFKKIEKIEGKQTIKDGVYKISTALDNNKVLEVKDSSKSNRGNIQISKYDGRTNQKFVVKYVGNGYYTITAGYSQKVLDVADGGTKNKTNVQQYASNGTDSQKWIIKDAGNGYYNIISKQNDLYLDVASGKTTDGTNIQVYESNSTNSQKFKFTNVEEYLGNETYEIISALNSNKVLDIAAGSTSNRARLQIWDRSYVSQQKFKLIYDGNGYYTIKNIKSGKVLDVDDAGKTNGTKVQQYTSNGTDAQKWKIVDAGNGYFYIISKCNGLYLDISNAGTSNGTKAQVYKGNGTKAQKFKFVKTDEVTLESGTYGKSGLKVKGDSRGTNLKYYKIGNGENVLFTTFSVHGFEDGWNKDGKELTEIAEDFKDKLVSMSGDELLERWTVYIFPSVNPDGANYGTTNNGPGRTSLYSSAPNHKGIDINRCWHISGTSYTRYTTSRNYNGTSGFQAYEARYLRDFLLDNKSTNGQTILVDLHGWLDETIGDNGLSSYYRSQYGISKHISSYGKGYLINWARTNLGRSGKSARTVLVELPEVKNHSAVVNAKYSTKYINATLNMMKGII